ncbi:MAG: 2-C-methyl-D-erythritol 2,4-cyclodiphosphate synthase [Halieaceae bacterium]|nr:2-C-methyl-D-erythritol 2,4-cyclodiphosphate synthase [Halieaceae bacterium]
MRIGHGFDVHAFAEAAPDSAVVLGGVAIAHSRCLRAHSDGDVVLHALCDALLGAVGAGDIGHHFPDTDPAFAGADSRELLRRVMHEVGEAGFAPVNADITVIAQEPRLAPHIQAMREHISADIELAVSCVNVKATTTEKLGYIGRGEGIAAHAVVLLQAL